MCRDLSTALLSLFFMKPPVIAFLQKGREKNAFVLFKIYGNKSLQIFNRLKKILKKYSSLVLKLHTNDGRYENYFIYQIMSLKNSFLFINFYFEGKPACLPGL